jgi:hypothetical protein
VILRIHSKRQLPQQLKMNFTLQAKKETKEIIAVHALQTIRSIPGGASLG